MITFRPFLRTFPSPQSTSSHFTSTLPSLRPLQIHPQIFTQPERTTFKRHITSSLSHYQSLPSDGQIPHRYIHLVQPDGTLSPLQPFTSIFKSYNHQTHTLQLVSHDPPIAKLLDKEEISRKALEAENRRQISNQLRESEKEVQIPWSAAEGDLKHKVELARDLLEKGHMVRLALAPRKKTAKDRLTEREKEGVVRFVEDSLGEVGDKSTADKLVGQGLLMLWSPKKSVKIERREKIVEKLVKVKEEKEAKKEERKRREEEKRKRYEERAKEL